ncbi:MAG: twitching motility protein PilT [Candidatus Schekmanbacteria bacterium RBG_16_38_11]|uniref:Twitching motility protein PilT n=1 Tax=Candidatus Schekmanbacteria bacterium RBG_16_38_11 TaxID=1817880 RepID=A0A1F7RV41_9BACT|nr:MAG: twitching motility protein PilT [Candidatus Schekmanbacteria bacterium RBG_16_38_11]
MFLVDSFGWIEYFTDGSLADDYYKYLKKPEDIITPAIVIYEVYKKIKKIKGEDPSLIALAQIKRTKIIPIDEKIALLAANLSIKYSLPMADSLILATAKDQRAKLVTSDPHFKKLEGVIFL